MNALTGLLMFVAGLSAMLFVAGALADAIQRRVEGWTLIDERDRQERP